MQVINQSSVTEITAAPETDNLYQESFAVVIFILVNNSCISTAIGLLGIVANIINMTVFLHQGLDSSINISLFSISISDTFTILFIIWSNFAFNPFIDQVPAPISFDEVYYVTGGWPSGFTVRVTLYITAYITAERCLSIVFPLKIKTMITPKRSKLIICGLTLINALTLIPEYTSIYLSWHFSDKKNETVLGVDFRSNRQQTQGITFMLHVALVVVGQGAVIFLTSVLVIHLRRQSKWRMKSSSEINHRSALSSRDRKSVALVIVVATSMVIAYIPLSPVSLVTVFVPEFYISGQLSRIFIETWGTIFLFSMINASSNILIYYNMNSKFRNTFRELFTYHQQLKRSKSFNA
ncbi:tachykinin-like peptides receptor 86C [Biomphalaria glabrata]|uniref:Tachykinin-like peptides receptor 86C n=1 Tax=Biomphalaria glabrata TaxID=6526 RepID=A0A2C9LAR8_BIOGL|nr:tachykinin-like peptides receptor 86C [Biomphalaria glabrata]